MLAAVLRHPAVAGGEEIGQGSRGDAHDGL